MSFEAWLGETSEAANEVDAVDVAEPEQPFLDEGEAPLDTPPEISIPTCGRA